MPDLDVLVPLLYLALIIIWVLLPFLGSPPKPDPTESRSISPLNDER